MNKGLIFAAGVVIGSVGTYFIVKKKIQDECDAEIKDVVDKFNERRRELEKKFKDEDKQEAEASQDDDKVVEIFTNQNIIDNSKYTNGDDEEDEDETEKEEKHIKELAHGKPKIAPYIITEEEFGEFGNDEKTLLYYSDGILADEDDIMVEDIFTTVGGALNQFNDPYCERIYVRDEYNEIDYTILRSDKDYKDIVREDS